MKKTALLLILLTSSSWAVTSKAWHDPSPHKVEFVQVESNVRVEVLDWGGTGRAVILLAGVPDTAHVFDDFALKLRPTYHVFGITRRGSGKSSVTESGYGPDRLGDDVVAVIDHLKLKKPVLAAHSYGGQEVSWVATHHPDRISGAVYLDAVYSNDAFFDADALYMITEWKKPLTDLQAQLSQLIAEPNDSTLVSGEVLKSLPHVQEIAETLIRVEKGRPPRPAATEADLQSFAAVRTWYARNSGVYLPESEVREMLVPGPDGRPTMKFRTPGSVIGAMNKSRLAFSNIPVPTLMLMAGMADPGNVDASDPEARKNSETFVWYQTRRLDRRAEQFRRDVPNGKLVQLVRADHYIFLSNEADVLREMRTFISGLRAEIKPGTE